MKKLLLIALVIMIAGGIGYYLYYSLQRNTYYPSTLGLPTNEQIPKTVHAEYLRYVEGDFFSLGRGIDFCRKNDIGVFKLWGNGGIIGNKIYFDLNGREVADASWGDILPSDPNEEWPPKDPFDDFTCTRLVESKGK
jgi:hypothetical protein